MNYLYLAVNLGAFIVPFIFSFHSKIRFNEKWRFAFPALLTAAIPFLIWDIYFTSIGVWGFSPKYVTGYYFFNLPIEEVLFFVCIPYSCMFTYHCFAVFVKKDLLYRYEKFISGVLIMMLIAFAIFNTDKMYTVFTFSFLAIFLLYLKMVNKAHWLSRFYFAYAFLLIPFLIVNGILTGTGLEEPVVWYNDHKNLGIRLLTIPIEDIFYGMLLILLNVSLLEKFQNKKLG